MGLINLASSKSVWRGLDYYQQNKVIETRKTDDQYYSAKVRNNTDDTYEVLINLEKVRSSQCTCLFKKDKPNAICKHIVVAYFAVFPKEAEDLQREYDEWEAGAQEREKQHVKELEEYVDSSSIEDLRDMALEYLLKQERYDYRY